MHVHLTVSNLPVSGDFLSELHPHICQTVLCVHKKACIIGLQKWTSLRTQADLQAEWLPLHVTASLARLSDHQAVSGGIYGIDDGKDLSCMAPVHSLCQ